MKEREYFAPLAMTLSLNAQLLTLAMTSSIEKRETKDLFSYESYPV